MKIHFSKANQILQSNGRSMAAWCKVRNELNKERAVNEVVMTEPEEHPYYPREFPNGVWNVFKPLVKRAPYLAPFFIPTDAWQMVDLWEVSDGKYVKKSGKTYRDSGYGLHFSTSRTTLGCIRIGAQADLMWLVDSINAALAKGEKVTLEVVS